MRGRVNACYMFTQKTRETEKLHTILAFAIQKSLGSLLLSSEFDKVSLVSSLFMVGIIAVNEARSTSLT